MYFFKCDDLYTLTMDDKSGKEVFKPPGGLDTFGISLGEVSFGYFVLI